MGSTDVTDKELNGIIQSYKVIHPIDGEQIVTGYLWSIGMCIPRRRIKESVHCVDLLEWKEGLALQVDA